MRVLVAFLALATLALVSGQPTGGADKTFHITKADSAVTNYVFA